MDAKWRDHLKNATWSVLLTALVFVGILTANKGWSVIVKREAVADPPVDRVLIERKIVRYDDRKPDSGSVEYVLLLRSRQGGEPAFSIEIVVTSEAWFRHSEGELVPVEDVLSEPENPSEKIDP